MLVAHAGQILGLLDGRGCIVGTDFLDQTRVLIEHIPLVTALRGIEVAFPVRPLNDCFVRVVADQNLFDGPL